MDDTDRTVAPGGVDEPSDLLRVLVDCTEDYAILTLDTSGNVASWNNGAERIKGYTADEIIGRHFSVFYRPQEVEAGHPEQELVLATERGRYSEDGWRVRKDGSLMWANVTLVALRGVDGQLRGFGKVTKDITLQKQAEDARADSEERFRQLAESMSDAYVLAAEPSPPVPGKKWDVAYAGGGFYDIFGFSPDEFVRTETGLRQRIHPDDAPRVLPMWDKSDFAGIRELEFRIVRPDGGVRWVRARYRWLASKAGVPRLACTFEDITERKHADAELAAARVAADEANRAKNAFLSRMSHELRTPLNAVLGFAQLLELRDLPDDVAEAVHHIRSAGDHLLALINDVLDISLIEAESLSLSMERVELPEVVREVVDLLRPMSERAGVTVGWEVPDGLPGATADRQRLRQVLLNLLSNAIKYNRPQGAVVLRVLRGEPSDRLRIEVEDTGPGIPESQMPRLFQAFDRLGAELTDTEGTGVGLALSLGLVNAMGGALSASSVLGRGSTFVVELPVADAATPAAVVSGTGPATAPDVPTDLGLRVVYVEDNTANVDVMRAMLRLRSGWTLVHAGTVGLALDLAVAEPPDLVLLDLHLPDMHGEEMLARMKAEPRLAGVPVVIVSADATRSEVVRLRAAGARDYLTKPIDVPTLLRLLDEVAAEAVRLRASHGAAVSLA